MKLLIITLLLTFGIVSQAHSSDYVVPTTFKDVPLTQQQKLENCNIVSEFNSDYHLKICEKSAKSGRVWMSSQVWSCKQHIDGVYFGSCIDSATKYNLSAEQILRCNSNMLNGSVATPCYQALGSKKVSNESFDSCTTHFLSAIADPMDCLNAVVSTGISLNAQKACLNAFNNVHAFSRERNRLQVKCLEIAGNYSLSSQDIQKCVDAHSADTRIIGIDAYIEGEPQINRLTCLNDLAAAINQNDSDLGYPMKAEN